MSGWHKKEECSLIFLWQINRGRGCQGLINHCSTELLTVTRKCCYLIHPSITLPNAFKLLPFFISVSNSCPHFVAKILETGDLRLGTAFIFTLLMLYNLQKHNLMHYVACLLFFL